MNTFLTKECWFCGGTILQPKKVYDIKSKSLTQCSECKFGKGKKVAKDEGDVNVS